MSAVEIQDGSRWVTHNGGYPASGIYTARLIYGGVTIRDKSFHIVSQQRFVEPFSDLFRVQCPDGTEREVTRARLLAWVLPFVPRGERVS